MKSFILLLLAAAFVFVFASADAVANDTAHSVSQPLVRSMSVVPCTSDVVQSPRFSVRVIFNEHPLSNHSGGSNDFWLLDIKLNGPQGGQFAVFPTAVDQSHFSAAPVAVVEQDAPCVWQVVVPSVGVVTSYDELRKCSPRPEYLVNVTVSSVTELCRQDPSNRVCKYKDVVVGGGVQDVTEATTCKKVALSSLPKPGTSAATTTPLSSALASLALVLAATTSTMMATSN